MSDTPDIQLPPPPPQPARRRAAPAALAEPRLDMRTKEGRAAKAEAQVRTEAHEPRPEEVRTRPSRAETVRKERRRRENVDKTGNLKLGFRFKPDPNFEYRWINHGVDGQRINDLTNLDDWDMVTADGEPSDGVGTALRRAVGESKSGPIYSYLCRKPKDLYDEDHRKGQARLDKMMKHIRQGRSPTDISRSLKPSDNVYGAEEIHLEEAKTWS